MIKIYFGIKRKLQPKIFLYVFATFTMILLTVDLVDHAKAHESSKTTKYVTYDEKKPENDFLSSIKSFKNNTNDVQMIPEKNGIVEKIQFYSNHNYGNKKLDRRMIYDLEFKENGLSKDFRFERKNTKDFHGFDPIFSKNVMNNKNIRSRTKVLWYNNSKPSRPSVPVDDSFVERSSKKANEKRNHHYYPHEINELMPNQSMEYFEDENESDKKNYLNNGSPFQLPAKGLETDSVQNFPTRTSNHYGKTKPGKSRRKPLTLFMDIYPMSGNMADIVEGKNPRKYSQRKHPRASIFFIPIKSKTGLTESVISRLISPKDKRNRLLVKLNLYPSRRKNQGNEFLKRGGYGVSIDRMRSENVALPAFFKRKKKSSNRCALVCHDPSRNHFKSQSKNKKRKENLR